MNFEINTLCCGCLCSDRKISKLDGLEKQCFSNIIGQISTELSAEPPFMLCWECHGQINSFTKFSQRVHQSYKLFKEYIKKPKSNPTPEPNPRLEITKIPHIDIQPKNLLTEETIKTEFASPTPSPPPSPLPLPETIIKKEDGPPETISDDETLLNISKKTVKVKKKKRKKETEIYKEVELNTEEIAEERRIAMSSDDYVNAMFKCDKCIVSFPNAEDLKDHIKIKHKLNSSNHKCTICECSFASEVSYNYHINKHKRRYQCVICNKNITSKRSALKHFEQAHYNGPPVELDIQSTHYDNGHETTEMENGKDDSTTQSTETFPCEFCDKIFRWKTSLRKHLETHRIETGQKRKPYCEPCRLSFSTTSNLQKHVKTSSKHQIQLKLRKLAESLPDSSNPEKHQAHMEQIRSSVNSTREMYPCPQCDKKFQWRGNLLRHVKSHVARANGDLVCKPCNRTFSSIATYKQHMKISKKHVSENDFKYMCSDCGKRFANKTRLKDHIDWDHLKNYVHTCSDCQKVFKSHTSLYLHKQVVHNKHHAEHLCDHCGKPFPNHAKLRSHITALHSGVSAYKCDVCGATFSWHSCLSRHARRVHRGKTDT